MEKIRRRKYKRKKMKEQIPKQVREYQEDLFNKDSSQAALPGKEEELIRAIKEVFGEGIEIFPGRPLKE